MVGRQKVIVGLIVLAIVAVAGTWIVSNRSSADVIEAPPPKVSQDGLSIKMKQATFTEGETIEATFTNDRSTSYFFTNGCKLRLESVPPNPTFSEKICTMALVEVAPGQSMTQSFGTLPVGSYIVSASLADAKGNATPQPSVRAIENPDGPPPTEITLETSATEVPKPPTVITDDAEASKVSPTGTLDLVEDYNYASEAPTVPSTTNPAPTTTTVDGFTVSPLTVAVGETVTVIAPKNAGSLTWGDESEKSSIGEKVPTDGGTLTHTYSAAGAYKIKRDQEVRCVVAPCPTLYDDLATITVTSSAASTSVETPTTKPSTKAESLQLRFTVVESLKKQPTVAPTLSSVSPTAAKIGDRITLTGTGLLGATVLWDELEGTPEITTKEYPPRTLPHIMTETELTITVPIELMPCNWANTECKAPAQGLSSGVHKLTVKTSKGTSEALTFTVLKATAKAPTSTTAPTLTSISPTSGKIGDTITLTGTSFSSDAKVLWDKHSTDGLTTAVLKRIDDSTLTVTVPRETRLCEPTPEATVTCEAYSGALGVGKHQLSVKTAAGTSNEVQLVVSDPSTVTSTEVTLSLPKVTYTKGETLVATLRNERTSSITLGSGSCAITFDKAGAPSREGACKRDALTLKAGESITREYTPTEVGSYTVSVFQSSMKLSASVVEAAAPVPSITPEKPIAPTLSSIAPTSGAIGSQITLKGLGFTDATTVLWDGHEGYYVNGKLGGVVASSDGSTLSLTVPSEHRMCDEPLATCEAESSGLMERAYKVSVKTVAGTSNEQSFSVKNSAVQTQTPSSPAPVLMSVTPSPAKPGAMLTLTGTGFENSTKSPTTVTLSGAGITPLALTTAKVTPTSLVAMLPTTITWKCPVYRSIFGLFKCPGRALANGTYELTVATAAGTSKAVSLTVSNSAPTVPTPATPTTPSRPPTGGTPTAPSSALSITAVTPTTVQGGKTVTVTGTGLTSTSKITLSLKGKVKSTLVPTMATKDGSKVTFLAPQVANTKCVFTAYGFCWPKTKTPGLDAGTYEVKVTNGKLTSKAKSITLQP